MKDMNAELARTQESIARWNRKLKIAMGKLTKLHRKRLRIENKIIEEREKQAQAMTKAGRSIDLFGEGGAK